MSEEKRRSKRQSHPATEEGWWDCSMCTYKNPPEFFKCEMCECRKGTSTRKPRVTTQITAQQVAQSVFTPPPPKKERREKRRATLSLDSTPELARDDSVEGDREEPDLPDIQQEVHVSPPVAPPIKVKRDPTSQVDTVTTTTALLPATSKPKKESSTKENEGRHSTKPHRKRPPRLKNIDRSSGQSMEVTVNNVTVIITDYKPKKEKAGLCSSSGGACSMSVDSKTNNINATQAAVLNERDGGESKDSFCSNQTDTVCSGGEGESVNGEVSSTVAES